MRDNLLKERPELFLKDNTVRPGILVLGNRERPELFIRVWPGILVLVNRDRPELFIRVRPGILVLGNRERPELFVIVRPGIQVLGNWKAPSPLKTNGAVEFHRSRIDTWGTAALKISFLQPIEFLVFNTLFVQCDASF